MMHAVNAIQTISGAERIQGGQAASGKRYLVPKQIHGAFPLFDEQCTTGCSEHCSGMGSGVGDTLAGCTKVEYGKNTNCSSIVSCGSDACSATNHVPSYGPLGFPVSAQNLFLDKLDHDPGVKGRIPGVCPSVPGYCAQGFLDNPCKFSCVNGADVNSIRTQDGTCTWGDLPLP